jgi:hypothetical protein
MDPMPRKKMPTSPPPSNGENGEPPEVDIAQLTTGLLFSPTSRATLIEDMAAAHDGEVARLRGWRAQVRAWLETAIPALQAPMRRLHWLRNERTLTALEAHEAAQLSAWLDTMQRQIADYQRAEVTLSQEIARHREAAANLRLQKGGRTGDHEKEPKRDPP